MNYEGEDRNDQAIIFQSGKAWLAASYYFDVEL